MLRYQVFNNKEHWHRLQLIAEVHDIEHALVVLQEWGDLLWDTYEQEWISSDRSQHGLKSPVEHPLNRGIFVAETPMEEIMPSAGDKVVAILELIHDAMPCSDDGDCLHCRIARLTI